MTVNNYILCVRGHLMTHIGQVLFTPIIKTGGTIIKFRFNFKLKLIQGDFEYCCFFWCNSQIIMTKNIIKPLDIFKTNYETDYSSEWHTVQLNFDLILIKFNSRWFWMSSPPYSNGAATTNKTETGLGFRVLVLGFRV